MGGAGGGGGGLGFRAVRVQGCEGLGFRFCRVLGLRHGMRSSALPKPDSVYPTKYPAPLSSSVRMFPSFLVLG